MATTDLFVRIIDLLEDNLNCEVCKGNDAVECEKNYMTHLLKKYFKDRYTAVYIILENMRCSCALVYLNKHVFSICEEDNIFPTYVGRSRRNTYGKFSGDNYNKVVNAILYYSERMETYKK